MTDQNISPDKGRNSSFRVGLFIPLVLFSLLAGLFLYSLSTGDPSKIPSVLIGKSVPEFELPPLQGLKDKNGTQIKGFSTQDLKKGEISIVNVWASWCGPCRVEHPHIMYLAQKSGAAVYGLNQKDTPSKAVRFLESLGNPYTAVGVDNGRVSIDWGVYGIPETFIVDGQGRILYKHVGPVTAELIQSKLMPIIQKARAKKE